MTVFIPQTGGTFQPLFAVMKNIQEYYRLDSRQLKE